MSLANFLPINQTIDMKFYYGHYELCKPSQLTITCSNSTIKTLEKSVKYVQS